MNRNRITQLILQANILNAVKGGILFPALIGLLTIYPVDAVKCRHGNMPVMAFHFQKQKSRQGYQGTE